MGAEKKSQISAKTQAPATAKSRVTTALVVLGTLGAITGAVLATIALLLPENSLPEIHLPDLPSAQEPKEAVYSNLTGLELDNAAEKDAPIFCIQTPNGMDGARPQAGLTEAGVIFEAIAEAGITRFAAIYQNPSGAVIGPIRSLRTYFLAWDTPFDCAIVHAGGPKDAVAALKQGSYQDLTENYSYMYRGTYGDRRWNNLFTTAADLRQYSADTGFARSSAQGFTRMTPEQTALARTRRGAGGEFFIIMPTADNTSDPVVEASEIAVNFGNLPNFNVVYHYDAESNTYQRSFASGAKHEVYDCPRENLGEKNPEDVCELKQLAPAVVVAMMVQESRASDDVHEDIQVTGTGEAYIFQDGEVLHGTWKKASWAEQIRFYDESGQEIALAPGQTIVEAVPAYGSIEF